MIPHWVGPRQPKCHGYGWFPHPRLVGSTTQWLEEIYSNLTTFRIQSIDLQTNPMRACTSVYTHKLYFQSGIIVGMGSANEIWRYIVMSPPIGWAHTQKDPANNLCKINEIRIPEIQNRLELISMVWNILFNPQMTCACFFIFVTKIISFPDPFHYELNIFAQHCSWSSSCHHAIVMALSLDLHVT